MTLFNQWWSEHDGSAIGNVPSPKLVVHTDTPGLTMNDGQQGFVRNAYAKFCTSVATSCFPKGYHRQEYSAADGTKVRMESINGTHKTQVWISGGGVEEKEEGALYVHLATMDEHQRWLEQSWVLQISPNLKRAKVVFVGVPYNPATHLFPAPSPKDAWGQSLFATGWSGGGGFGATRPATVLGRKVVASEEILTGEITPPTERTFSGSSTTSSSFSWTEIGNYPSGERYEMERSSSDTYSFSFQHSAIYNETVRSNGVRFVAGDKVIHSLPTTYGFSNSVSNISTTTPVASLEGPEAGGWNGVFLQYDITVSASRPTVVNSNLTMTGAHQDYVFLEETSTSNTPSQFRNFAFPTSFRVWIRTDENQHHHLSGGFAARFNHRSNNDGAEFGITPVSVSSTYWRIDKKLEKTAVSAEDIINAAQQWFVPGVTTDVDLTQYHERHKVQAAADSLQFVSIDKTHICYPARVEWWLTMGDWVGVRYEKQDSPGLVRKADMLTPIVSGENADWWRTWRHRLRVLPGADWIRRGDWRGSDVVGLKSSYYALVGYWLPPRRPGAATPYMPVTDVMLCQAAYGSRSAIAEARLFDLLPQELQDISNKLYAAPWPALGWGSAALAPDGQPAWGGRGYPTPFGARDKHLIYRGPP